MSKNCSVCELPLKVRERLDAEIRSGVSVNKVAAKFLKYGVSRMPGVPPRTNARKSG